MSEETDYPLAWPVGWPEITAAYAEAVRAGAVAP
jgi:hypothetical protein